MAIDRQIWGPDNESVVEQLWQLFGGGIDESDPFSVMLAVHEFDRLCGVAEEGDRVVIIAGYGIWVLQSGLITGPSELVQLLEKISSSDGEPSASDCYRAERLANSWFEIDFDRTTIADQLPQIFHGRKLTVRVLTENEASKVDFWCASVRTDGQLIETPPARPALTQF